MFSTNSRAARPNSGRSARNQTSHGLAPRALLAGSLAFALIACAPAAVTPQGGSGGKSGSGGSSSGGSNSGGSASGGSNSGGSAKGGSASGGSNSGGSSSGGSNSGGSNSGGSSSGGSAKGGSNSGGSSSGGSNSGGSNSGGSNSGGSASGGSNSGGSSSGGSNSGGNAQGGSSPNGGSAAGGTSGGATPPGWWTSWKTEGWHGCAWTGKDILASSTTSIKPSDFTAKAAADPYKVTGTVMKDPGYNGVALLGFNLNQDPAGASCLYDPALATAKGPPGVTFASSATGIAINFSKTSAFKLRIQIQTENGATSATDRWCQTILAVNGKAFMPFNKFYTQCWNDDGLIPAKDKGALYAGQPVSAIVFAVPGELTDVPFDFTVNGFALGTSAADAPDGGAPTGPLTGTIGGPGSPDLDFKRVKVVKDGKEYIIQNNNWGSPATDQTLSYSDNSFKIVSPTGNGPGGGAPASFPSIYIGNNGNTEGGAMSTSATDGLPKQISAISSIQTTLAWTGSCDKGFNTAYDVWFSASNPPPANYKDAVSGFLMVWLCDPSDQQPIGSVQGNAVTIAGKSWNVWFGQRGSSGSSVGSTNPVVSYVPASGAMNTLSFNLKDFITDAVTRGYLQSGWYLTDVFGGFEIWTGSTSSNLAVTNFTAVVQ
jgi:hypothetical protein